MVRVVLAGATDGIGKALAEHYASLGFWVTVIGRDHSKLDALVASLRQRFPVATVHGVLADLADGSQVEAAFHESVALSGHCDVFCWIAGLMVDGDGLSCDAVADQRMLQLNTVSAIHMLGLFANYFRVAGRGHLVGIGSIAGDRGRRGNPAYGASKAALATYLEGLRNRLAPFGVRVTTVKPGFVGTRMLAGKKVFWVAPVDVAARTIARRVAAGHEVFYVYRRWWWVARAIQSIPRALFKKIGPP